MSNLETTQGPQWRTAAFGAFAKLRKGIAYSADQYCEPGKGAAFLTIKSVEKHGGYKAEGLKFYAGPIPEHALLSEGDLLIANTDLTRAGDIVGCPLVVPKLSGQQVTLSMDLSKVFVDEQQVDKALLRYLLETEQARRFMRDHASGSTVLHLTTSAVPKLTLSFPRELKEQRRIADLLSAMDEQVLALSATIEKKKALRAGVVRRLILGPNRPTGWKLHGLAKNWEVSRFGTEFSLQLGKMLSSVAKTGSGEVPYLGNRSVQWRRFELESLETMYFNPREKLKYELRKGDLLICEGGEVGRAAVWQGASFECFYQKAIHRARASSGRVLPDFALAILELASELGWFADYVVQTSIAHLPREKLMEFPLPVPSPSEQRVICSAIDAINQDVEMDAQAMAKLTKMSHGLRAALLQPKTC